MSLSICFCRFLGYYWCGEYGNPDLPEEFEWIKTISPLHNIPTNPTMFPAILITTADHDDRVVPAHSFKYIAQLQHQLSETMNRLKRPLIIRIDVRAGHGKFCFAYLINFLLNHCF